MTEPESTSAVELAVAARIQAARRRTEDMRRQRAELAAARKAGLARRHVQRLRNLAAAEEKAQQQRLDDGQDDEPATDGQPDRRSEAAS